MWTKDSNWQQNEIKWRYCTFMVKCTDGTMYYVGMVGDNCDQTSCPLTNHVTRCAGRISSFCTTDVVIILRTTWSSSTFIVEQSRKTLSYREWHHSEAVLLLRPWPWSRIFASASQHTACLKTALTETKSRYTKAF